MITDHDACAALRNVTSPSFIVLEVTPDAGEASILLQLPSGAIRGLRIPLPSAHRPNPFEYATPLDASDWANMVKIWLEEESETGAAGWAAIALHDGIEWFTVETYGLRPADDVQHARLRRAAGPDGWHGAPD